MGKKLQIVTNSLLYTIGNLLLKAFSFFLIPLYTAYLSTEDYGIINLVGGFYGLASALLMLGLQHSVVRFYADYKDDHNKVARMYGSVISLILILGTLFVSLSILAQELLTSLFFKGIAFFPVVLLAVVISATSSIYTIYQEILKGRQEARYSVILSYFYFFFQLGFNVLFLVKLKMGAVGTLTAGMFAYLLMIAVMFYDLLQRKLLIFCVDIKLLSALLKYSLPLVPHTISYNFQTYVTRLIIKEQLSLSILGIYSLASQFGNVADIVLNSVQAAFRPWMYESLNVNEVDAKKNIAQATYFLMWLYGLLFLLIGVFSQEALLIMTSKNGFSKAWLYIPFIVSTVSLKTPLYFYSNFMFYDKRKAKFVFVSTLVGCIVSVFFTWVLTPDLNVYGTILANVFAIIARQILVVPIVYKEVREIYSLIKVELLSILPIPFMALALLPEVMWYNDVLSFKNIGIKCLVVLLYCGLMMHVNGEKAGVFFRKIRKARKS